QKEWKETGKQKMDSDPFVLDVRLNGTDFVTGLVDSGCLCYSAINEQLFRSLRLPSIKIAPRQLEEAAGKNAEPVIGMVWSGLV
ncbi:hypothetical protein Alg215_12334, partial [Pyrenophora tritici-repentis]